MLRDYWDARRADVNLVSITVFTDVCIHNGSSVGFYAAYLSLIKSRMIRIDSICPH